ncbi:Phosphatidylinositol (PI) 3-kinase [Puccinia graminis f. sp. tritici]|uniref:Phosphatidylinositol 3-kinase VPS34 n=2 Tax=Puccinia graminis f. sp. tritici TaxID=56615 RepID=E3L2M3_PUCGT|nr:uncharacterized protein PGTG_16800 [Puccinia graminis f. sp. tritici CRL 75-36-700-3]EFP90774.2 hypothetical protein PGTG_16800 [Puccinia graminis f. sp. tritici CRL 75-36-700-3]KAA1108465.1 Phosphatidylinositol (PI) 3-kinase [Puccinia graminis f. sp. tritici]KAA1138588.1 Phosphatidylinositol (PI) 3-kinase [Puccinia graminis f. sp. tritici]
MERLAEAEQALTLAKSCDIDLPVTLRISRIEGNYHRSQTKSYSNLRTSQPHSSPLPDLYVAVQLWAENRPLTLPFYTPHKNFSTSFTWATPITLPIKYRDLPHSAQLAFTILDVNLPDGLTHTSHPLSTTDDTTASIDQTTTDNFLLSNSTVVGGTTLALFGKKRTLRKGKQRCFIHRDRIADGNVSSTTPSKIAIVSESDPNSLEVYEESDKLGRLEKLVKKHERGDLPRLEWLDQLAFRQIERIHAQETAKSRDMYLYVDLPRFDFPILFNEIELPAPSLPSTLSAVTQPAAGNTSALYSPHHLADIFTVVDPDMVHDNPIESKHTRLHRSHRNGPLDRELRPEKSVRDVLNNILSYPPTRTLTRDERDLVWRFRFYLSHDKRALTKFLKSVVWSDKGEVSQAIGNLLPIWSEISLDDALELLGPSDDYREPRIKQFAVQQLARAEDDELVLYLLQLVQALKFDQSPSVSFDHHKTSPSSTVTSPIAQSQRFSVAPSQRVSVGSSSTVLGRENRSSFTPNVTETPPRRDSQIKPLSLEDFLIERSCANPAVLGYQFYWYLTVEASADGDKSMQVMYGRVLQKFYDKMRETDRGRSMAETIQRQKSFVMFLSKLANEIRTSKDGRPKKIEKLKHVLKDPAKLAQLFSVDSTSQIAGLPLPLDSSKMIVGVDTDSSTVFKSNLFPLRLALRCSDGTEYPVIFKDGDDLRQDQLVIQLISLMDRLLRKENLDLRLTPYKVLATGQTVGLVQFITSKTLGEVAAVYQGGILEYLRTENPDSGGSLGHYGVLPSVLENFVRSCAGYCVVTYILGVGDRHLDNLMISPSGHFFHVDFGYILGRDPKPFPPSIKVCKEMVDGMGGDKSSHYGRFKRLCYTAFICLRKNSGLIINLVGLMIEANIPDIKLEPDKAVMKVQEKFRLDLSEEEAIKHFENELNDTSYFTVVFDKIHAVAQYWRA